MHVINQKNTAENRNTEKIDQKMQVIDQKNGSFLEKNVSYRQKNAMRGFAPIYIENFWFSRKKRTRKINNTQPTKKLGYQGIYIQ